MATVTSSLATAGAPMKALHSGLNTIRVHIDVSATTLSDIVLLAKLPQRALVTDISGQFGTSNVDSAIKLGWKAPNSSTDNETAFGTHTSSTTDAVTLIDFANEELNPTLISFTDSIGLAYAVLYATCSTGSFTDTWSLDLVIQYTMDHGEGVN
jgi:acyl-CoA synthetase (NDP forming)